MATVRPPEGFTTISGASRLTRSFKSTVLVGTIIVIVLVIMAGSVSPILIPFVIAVALAVGVAVFRKSVFAMVRWKAPTLTLPTGPHALGSELEIIYRRASRSIRDLPQASLHVVVVCEERATYRKGTDTVTDTQRVVANRTIASGHGTAEGFEAKTLIQIPADAGGPTLDLANNEIRWYIEAVIHGPGLPDDEQRFSIRVAPIVDRRLLDEVGDR